MSWVKIDDNFPDHPKLWSLGKRRAEAMAVVIAVACWCSRNLTDGRIPKSVCHGVTPGARMTSKMMCQVGLLIDDGDSYLLNDYLDYNPSAAEVKAARERSRERQRRYRNGVTNGVTNTAPIPIPIPKEIEKVKTLVRKPAKSAGSDGFEGWWDEQVRKEGKGAARKAYARALLVVGEPDNLMDAWKTSKAAYIREGRDRTKFPLPATWLNQERWEDDYAAAPVRAMRAPCTNPDCQSGVIYDRDTDTAIPCPDCRGAS